jgi:hypothetical protein
MNRVLEKLLNLLPIMLLTVLFLIFGLPPREFIILLVVASFIYLISAQEKN